MSFYPFCFSVFALAELAQCRGNILLQMDVSSHVFIMTKSGQAKKSSPHFRKQLFSSLHSTLILSTLLEFIHNFEFPALVLGFIRVLPKIQILVSTSIRPSSWCIPMDKATHNQLSMLE